MNCRKIENNLIGYIEKTLPATLMNEFEAHLKECVACKALVGDVNKTYTSPQHLPKPSVNPFFYTQVTSRLHNKEDKQILKPNYLHFPRVAASLLILVGICLGMFIGGRIHISNSGNISQNEMLEEYTSEYNLDDSGVQVLESIITNE